MRAARLVALAVALGLALSPAPGCEQCAGPKPAGATRAAELAAALRAKAARQRREAARRGADRRRDGGEAPPEGPEIPAPPVEDMPEDHPPTVKRRAEAVRFVPPADLSITAVLSNRQALNGTRLSVRGKVIKVSHGVMGRNWLHLMDRPGGGKLVVSTRQIAAVGDLVRATGRFGTEVDVGAGFKMAAILRGARVKIERKASDRDAGAAAGG